MKTFTETKKDADKNRKWLVVDATGKSIGRLCSKVASILRGKENPRYTTNIDTGDFVIVLNAEKVKFTGDKLEKKKYYRHTGFIGGVKIATALELMTKNPENLIKQTVKGMLPKNVLGRQQITKLKVYKGSVHPHSSQEPKELTL